MKGANNGSRATIPPHQVARCFQVLKDTQEEVAFSGVVLGVGTTGQKARYVLKDCRFGLYFAHDSCHFGPQVAVVVGCLAGTSKAVGLAGKPTTYNVSNSVKRTVYVLDIGQLSGTRPVAGKDRPCKGVPLHLAGRLSAKRALDPQFQATDT
jgi:hypothetical protein